MKVYVMRRYLAIIIGLALTAGLFGGPALAAKPLYSGNREPMHLTRSVYVQNGEINVPGCLNEDDKDQRWYYGWLPPGESFTADPTVFCNPYLNGASDGNTGAFLELYGDTDYAIDWWLAWTHQDGSVEIVPLAAQIVYSKGRSVTWVGCEAKVPGTVYLTITNIGRHGSDTDLATGSQWHDTWGNFYYDCP